MIPCYDKNGKQNGMYLSDYGKVYENGNEVIYYNSTNGLKYVYYIIDVSTNKRILIELGFVILISRDGLYNYKEYDVIHLDSDITNYSLTNISYHSRIEIWKDATNELHGKYQISNNGRVRSCVDNHIVVGSKFKIGYIYSTLLNKKYTHHRLVAIGFVTNPNIDKYKIINHIDSDPTNNYDWNLEWCDDKINMVHSSMFGNMATITIDEADIIRDELMNPVNRGSSTKIYEKLKHIYPNISKRIIRCIKYNNGYKFSRKYNLDDIKYPEYICDKIPTEDIDYIRDLLLDNDCSPSKVYKKLDHVRYPNISMNIIKAIKLSKKPYLRSKKYDIGKIKNIFDKHKNVLRGRTQHMKSMEKFRTEIIDLIRELLLTKTFHGSPRMVYNALNHDKYPLITESTIKQIKYGTAYDRSDMFDLNDFSNRINTEQFSTPSNTLIKTLINSYMNGESDITDESYDLLVEELVSDKGESSRPYMRVEKGTINSMTQTLPKTYGVNVPMREGQKTYRDWIATKKITPEQPILIQPKYDGCSVAFDFKSQRFFTRGDYENGESVDVTELFADRIDWLNRWKEHEDRCCPWNPTGLKFEAILDVGSYDHYNRTHPDNQYKRPRDYVAAAMTSRDAEMCKKISLLSLRALAEDGREYIPQMLWNNSVYSSAHNFERIEQFIKDCLSNNATYNTMLDCEIDVDENYKIDGVVVSVCLDEPGEECFIDGDNEVAIKILKDVKQTKLRDIIWQIGKTGKITPVARLQPVKFDNITVDHVTLSTFDRVMQMDLRYDDTVDIMYNIVPYFVGSHHDGSLSIPIPKNCPTCGQPLNTLMKTVRCLNPNCPSVIIGGIVRYCEKMKMMGVSDGIIRDLYDCHLVESIPDLYGINTGQIAYLDGYGDKAEANIINSIWKASEDVELHKWFGAMPINDISDKTWKIIFDTIFQRDMNVALSNMADWVKNHDKEPLLDALIIYGNKFPNIGAAKLRSIVQGIHQNWDLICKTFPYIKFKVTPNMDNIKGTVALTGTRDQGITAALTQHGWLVMDFNTKVNLLVIPNPSFTSHKTELAKKHNIPIRTIEETYDMLGMKGMNENG